MSLKPLVQAWNRFFFEPIPPTAIAVYRILFGLLVLINGALLAPDLLVWFGEKGALTPATALILTGGSRINLIQGLPAGDGWVVLFFIVFMVAAFCLMVGLGTRVSAVAVFLGLVSFHHRNTLILNSGDTFMRLASFFLIFSQAGAALSVDRWWRVRRGLEEGEPAPSAPWAQRLIQIQVAVVYGATFLSKVNGSMWIDGTALYYTSRLEEFFRFPVPYAFQHLWTIKVGTWTTLAVELAMAILVWFKELRLWVLAAGVLLHLGIEYSMNIALFSFVMVSAYVTFLESGDLKRFSILNKTTRGPPLGAP